MNDQTKQALQHGTEALERLINRAERVGRMVSHTERQALLEMREALAQPQDHSGEATDMVQGSWVDLTDDEQEEIANCEDAQADNYNSGYSAYDPYAIIRLGIAKFKSKNTPKVVPQGEPTELHRVVSDHIADLRGCVPTLMKYPEMASTMKEVEKAANELEAALMNDKRITQPQDHEKQHDAAEKEESLYALGYKAGLDAAKQLCESEGYEYNQGYSCARAIADLPIAGETK